MKLKLLEPLREFFKDEVRSLAKSLDLIPSIRKNILSPGPGC